MDRTASLPAPDSPPFHASLPPPAEAKLKRAAGHSRGVDSRWSNTARVMSQPSDMKYSPESQRE